MIAVDTSSFVAYLNGSTGDDVTLVQSALEHQHVVLPPVVLTELLSDPALPPHIRTLFSELPLLETHAGYWERAGLLRGTVLQLGRRARVADALIAQSCADHRVPVVTRDRDFRHFAASIGLHLL